MTRSTRHEDGSASLEGALACVGLVVFLGVVAATGRYAAVNAAIDNATYAAARAASIARTPGQARSDADTAVRTALDKSRVDCKSRSVDINTAAFAVEPGTPSTITVQVSCDVNVGDIAFVPAGSKTFISRASSSLDTYRER